MKYTTILFSIVLATASAQQAPSRSQAVKKTAVPVQVERKVDPIDQAIAADNAAMRENEKKIQASLEGAAKSAEGLFGRFQKATAPMVEEAKKMGNEAAMAAGAQAEKEAPRILQAKTAFEKAQSELATGVIDAAKRVADETMK